MTTKIQTRGSHSYKEEEIAIDSTGEKIVFDVIGNSLTSINIEGEETADYSLDVGPKESVRFQDEETYSGTDIRDTFEKTDRYMAIRVTSAAATSGSTATVTVQVAE